MYVVGNFELAPPLPFIGGDKKEDYGFGRF